jgi:hypothetical protein
MLRKLLSVVAALACLSLLTAGAVHARPLATPKGAPEILQQLWQWVTSAGSGSLEKEGPGMDPNGQKHGPRPGRSLPGVGTGVARTGGQMG